MRWPRAKKAPTNESPPPTPTTPPSRVVYGRKVWVVWTESRKGKYDYDCEFLGMFGCPERAEEFRKKKEKKETRPGWKCVIK